MADHEDGAHPPRVEPRIRSAPRPRQVYWCDFPLDAHLPEMWKKRPVVVLSKKATLRGVVQVVPLSTKSQPDNPAAHPFNSPLKDGGTTWAICSHLTTVAVSRLDIARGKPPKVTQDDFTTILRLALGHLPALRQD